MLKFFRKKPKVDKAKEPVENNESPAAEPLVETSPQPEQSIQSQDADVTTELASQVEANREIEPELTPEPIPEPTVEKKPKRSLFQRLKQSLTKTRSSLTEGIASLFLGKKTIDDELLEELETLLLIADVGVECTQRIIDTLVDQVSRKQLKDPQALFDTLRKALLEILSPCEHPLSVEQTQKPFVLLMVGVNGAGKTTTIGKIAKQYKSQNKEVMLAAGDTFRAAAVEQLKVWGERNDVPVIAQHTGADSASVIYDALQSATAKQADILIADTAGRLHTRDNLMEELKKIIRVAQKIDPNAPHETMLVLDATMGQNALQQARVFHKMINLTGIAITKLDGTAKGGIIFAIANELNLPIRYIGVGESIDDLRPFNAKEFVDALLTQEKEELTN